MFIPAATASPNPHLATLTSVSSSTNPSSSAAVRSLEAQPRNAAPLASERIEPIAALPEETLSEEAMYTLLLDDAIHERDTQSARLLRLSHHWPIQYFSERILNLIFSNCQIDSRKDILETIVWRTFREGASEIVATILRLNQNMIPLTMRVQISLTIADAAADAGEWSITKQLIKDFIQKRARDPTYGHFAVDHRKIARIMQAAAKADKWSLLNKLLTHFAEPPSAELVEIVEYAIRAQEWKLVSRFVGRKEIADAPFNTYTLATMFYYLVQDRELSLLHQFCENLSPIRKREIIDCLKRHNQGAGALVAHYLV